MQYAPSEDREHQRNMLEVELNMTEGPVSKANGIGWSTPEQWRALNESLLEFGGVSTSVAPEDMFSDRILRSVYKDGQLIWP
jgi:hypothetical protein